MQGPFFGITRRTFSTAEIEAIAKNVASKLRNTSKEDRTDG